MQLAALICWCNLSLQHYVFSIFTHNKFQHKNIFVAHQFYVSFLVRNFVFQFYDTLRKHIALVSVRQQFTLVLQTNCVRQLERWDALIILRPWCYWYSNHYHLGNHSGLHESSTLKCAFVKTPSQMFWGLSVYYSCKMTWARLFMYQDSIVAFPAGL